MRTVTLISGFRCSTEFSNPENPPYRATRGGSTNDRSTRPWVSGRYLPFAIQNSVPARASDRTTGNRASPQAFAQDKPFRTPAPFCVTYNTAPSANGPEREKTKNPRARHNPLLTEHPPVTRITPFQPKQKWLPGKSSNSQLYFLYLQYSIIILLSKSPQ